MAAGRTTDEEAVLAFAARASDTLVGKFLKDGWKLERGKWVSDIDGGF